MNVSGLIAESLLRTRSEAIIAADRDGLICFWNPGAERIFGHSAADAIGHSLDLIIPGRLRSRHWEGYRGTIATGKSRYGEGCSQCPHCIKMGRRSRSNLQSCRYAKVPAQ
jgi:PAS domain-containing protein